MHAWTPSTKEAPEVKVLCMNRYAEFALFVGVTLCAARLRSAFRLLESHLLLSRIGKYAINRLLRARI